MKLVFVFDESAIEQAGTGRNERGEEDESAQRLLERIVADCHAIAFSNELLQRTVQRLSRLLSASAPLAQQLHLLVQNLLRNPEKLVYEAEPAVLEYESVVPADDQYWVRLVVHTGATGVTTDDRLLVALREAGLTSRYGLTLLRPEAALERIVGGSG